MAEENVDTKDAPADGAGLNEPAEPDEPKEPTGDDQHKTPTESYITAEQLEQALQRVEQSNRSWLGRRDKELLSNVGSIVEERLSNFQNRPSDDEISSKLLENPRDVIRAEMEAYEAERASQSTRHINSTMEMVGTLMEADPLYVDKELGNEVVEEIKAMVQTGKINTKLPPAEAGKIVLGDALSNVLRKRKGLKTTALKNSPQNTPGSLPPPATPSKPKPKLPKLDEYTKKMAEKWGYKEEDLVKLYGQG